MGHPPQGCFTNIYQLIEIWETFLMQLDTEEGETFVPPAGVVASPVAEQNSAAKEHTDAQDAEDSETRDTAELGAQG